LTSNIFRVKSRYVNDTSLLLVAKGVELDVSSAEIGGRVLGTVFVWVSTGSIVAWASAVGFPDRKLEVAIGILARAVGPIDGCFTFDIRARRLG